MLKSSIIFLWGGGPREILLGNHHFSHLRKLQISKRVFTHQLQIG